MRLSRFRFIIILFIFLFTSETITTRAGESGGIDLHAHTFMSHGMSWGFSGDFFDPTLRATHWADRIFSKINEASVNQSGLSILVVTLYAHPLFNYSLRDSIRSQLRQLKTFLKRNPNWVLATSASQAKFTLTQGKKVVILALEGASGILETEQDLIEFVDQGGIRIVTLLHFTDDLFGGVAFMSGVFSLSTPFSWFESILKPQFTENVLTNHNGITLTGRRMVRRLQQRKVWIDLSHASDQSQRDLLPILKEAHRPLLYTHTVLRKYHHAERGIANWQMQEVLKTGGVVGLIPSESMLHISSLDKNKCKGSIFDFVVHYEDLAHQIPKEAINLGSDFNGALDHLSPPNCPTHTSFDQEGLWNIGQEKDFWSALRKIRADIPDPQKRIQYFLQAWSRVAP